MIFIQCDLNSQSLGHRAHVNLLLPERPAPSATPDGKPLFPVLTLLHGTGGDESDWLRLTSIERYAEPYGLALVLPAAGNSFYADMVHGERVWTYVSEELPELLRGLYPLSARREDNFVAGLSMGGYGAFKLALRHPERFAAAASLSGALDIVAEIARDALPEVRFADIFAQPDQVQGSDDDLFALLERQAAQATALPRLYLACGAEDFLYAQSVRFRDAARTLGVNLTYEEAPGGHTWEFWDALVQRALRWLPLPGRAS